MRPRYHSLLLALHIANVDRAVGVPLPRQTDMVPALLTTCTLAYLSGQMLRGAVTQLLVSRLSFPAPLPTLEPDTALPATASWVQGLNSLISVS